MNYINEVLSKLTDKQKKMMITLSFGQITLEEYITTRLIKHVDEDGCVKYNGEIMTLEEYVNHVIDANYTALERFIKNNDCDIDKLQPYFTSNIGGIYQAKKNDIDYTLTWGNLIYHNNQQTPVCIKDIIGSMRDDENMTLKEMLDTLYSSDGDTYSSRANRFLNQDMEYNIENIKSSRSLPLIMIGDKYYVAGDGNHRIYYMMLCYLIEMSKCQTKEQIEELNKKYTLTFDVQKKSNNELLNMVAYAMSKCWADDFKVTIIDDNKGLYRIRTKGNEFDISSNEELTNMVEAYLEEAKSEKLRGMLDEIGYFKKTNMSYENDSSNQR